MTAASSVHRPYALRFAAAFLLLNSLFLQAQCTTRLLQGVAEASGTINGQGSYETPQSQPNPLTNGGKNPYNTPPSHDATPDQIKLTLYSATSMLVSWVSGLPAIGKPSDVHPPSSTEYAGTVWYGTSAAYLTAVDQTQNNVVYDVTYTSSGNNIQYSSGVQHHVLLSGLTPGQTYLYKVGDSSAGSHGVSDLYSFKQPSASFPLRISVWGDAGLTDQSVLTFQNIVNRSGVLGVPDLMLNVGDLSYADKFNAEANSGDGVSSYQPRWDQFGRLLQSTFSTFIPVLSNGGNHEIEMWPGNKEKTSVSYNARFPQPNDAQVVNTSNNYGYATFALRQAGPFNNVKWSLKLSGLVALISLSPYYPYEAGAGTQQYEWFQSTMSSLNRATYPWVIVSFHAPMFVSYSGAFKCNECFRQLYEPLFQQYKVDFVLSGHSHDYERTHPMYNFSPQTCGTVYMLTGSAGIQSENALIDTSPQPSFCSTNTAAQQSAWASNEADSQVYFPNQQACTSYQFPGGQFCPPAGAQPAYSAFRSDSLGSALLTLNSATSATWSFYRNEDPLTTAIDSVTYTRNPAC